MKNDPKYSFMLFFAFRTVFICVDPFYNQAICNIPLWIVYVTGPMHAVFGTCV